MQYFGKALAIVCVFFFVACQDDVRSSQLLDTRPGPDEFYKEQQIQESLAELRKHGAEILRLEPKYEEDADLKVKGPFYLLEKFPGRLDLQLGGVFSTLASEDSHVKNALEKIQNTPKTRLLFAPNMNYTGLASSRVIDEAFHKAVLADQPAYISQLDSLLFVGTEMFYRAFIHEMHHIEEINSGRLIQLTESMDNLDAKLKDKTTNQAPLARYALLESYRLIAELTAEYVNFSTYREELKRFTDFLAFMEGPAAYPGLNERLSMLNDTLDRLRNDPTTQNMFQDICKFIDEGMKDTVIPKDVNTRLFRACSNRKEAGK